jgi:gas vesicle protein
VDKAAETAPPRRQIVSETLRDEEETRTQEESGNRLAWFLTGLTIGAAAAVLYAPRSGKQTRRFLTERGQAVTETGKDIADASRDMYERGRKLVEDAAELFERGRKLVRG